MMTMSLSPHPPCTQQGFNREQGARVLILHVPTTQSPVYILQSLNKFDKSNDQTVNQWVQVQVIVFVVTRQYLETILLSTIQLPCLITT